MKKLIDIGAVPVAGPPAEIDARKGKDLAFRRVVADDGCALNVHVLQTARSDHAVPVLFIHALAMDGKMWQGVVNALNRSAAAPQGAMLAMDCRGHGASDSSEPVFTTARFAQDIASVLDSAHAPRAHIVGCSMGGTVALAFAAKFASRVASLTLIDTTAWYGEQAPANWEQRAQTAIEGGMAALVEFQRARWFSPQFLSQQPALVQYCVDVFLANRVSAYANSCRMLGHADERAGLTAYRGPAAVIVGEDDYATPPAMAQEIVAGIAGASLHVIKGARHYTPLEAPQAVAQRISALIQNSAS